MSVKHLYLLPGLGADERLFQYIHLPDVQLHHIKYPKPQQGDTLDQFIQQLSLQIKEEPFALLGCSIGGIFAVELAKKISVEKIILVGSIKNHKERPFYFAWLKTIPLHKLLPISLLKKIGGFASALAGKHSANNLALLAEMLEETPNDLIKWGIKQIIHWKNEILPCEIIHLQGSRDLVFPANMIKNAQLIEKGAHFSVLLDKGSEVNTLIKQAI